MSIFGLEICNKFFDLIFLHELKVRVVDNTYCNGLQNPETDDHLSTNIIVQMANIFGSSEQVKMVNEHVHRRGSR